MYEKNGVAILTPGEYDGLRSAVKPEFKILLDVLLFTGMRYEEIKKLQKHQEWYDTKKKIIYLPREADKKKKRVSPSRYVYLSSYGNWIVERFFDDNTKPYPTYQVFDENLKRWSKKALLKLLNGVSISVKTFRKTWECWLVCSYPERLPLIAMSQGHTELIAMNHYLNIPFSPEEIKAIKEKTNGWLNVTSY